MSTMKPALLQIRPRSADRRGGDESTVTRPVTTAVGDEPERSIRIFASSDRNAATVLTNPIWRISAVPKTSAYTKARSANRKRDSAQPQIDDRVVFLDSTKYARRCLR